LTARLILNYKKIPYTTIWIEYPDIAPAFSSKGIPPNDPSSVPWEYTAPAIRLPNGEYLMESSAIAARLDAIYPEPALPMKTPDPAIVTGIFERLLTPLKSILLIGVHDILNPRSQDYFRQDREQKFVESLDQWRRERKQLEEDDGVAKAVKPQIDTLVAMLQESESGPWLMGSVVSYADLVIVAWLRFYEELSVLETVLSVDSGALRGLYEAASLLLKRCDH
jgi:glutathione S-transferase